MKFITFSLYNILSNNRIYVTAFSHFRFMLPNHYMKLMIWTSCDNFTNFAKVSIPTFSFPCQMYLQGFNSLQNKVSVLLFLSDPPQMPSKIIWLFLFPIFFLMTETFWWHTVIPHDTDHFIFGNLRERGRERER